MSYKTSQLSIGYVPYSLNLSHPADRRRLGAWSQHSDISLNTVNPEKSDVMVLSNAANFGKWIGKSEGKIVVDLVDGYIAEKPNFAKDFLRNCLRTLNGTSSLRWVTYTRHLKYACSRADAVVVASEEQLQSVFHLNKKILVIPDIHLEIDSQIREMHKKNEQLSIGEQNNALLWEGFGYTLKNLKSIAKTLDQFLYETNSKLFLVTDTFFPRWGGFLGRIVTRDLVASWFPKSSSLIEIIPWSLDNLVKCANQSKFAVIPIDLTDSFALMKSENKLLSMWRLGLVTLFSSTPAYSRVAIKAGLTELCLLDNQWEEKLKLALSDGIDFEHLRFLASRFLEEEYSSASLLSTWDDLLKGITLGD
jgi:hypothetical protein